LHPRSNERNKLPRNEELKIPVLQGAKARGQEQEVPSDSGILITASYSRCRDTIEVVKSKPNSRANQIARFPEARASLL
jgi:hypothetical protein